MIRRPEKISAEDKDLLERAAAREEGPALRDCSPLKLTELAREHGLDFATAVLHDRVLRHPEHRAFFQQIQNNETATASPCPLVASFPAPSIANTKTPARTGRDSSPF